MSTKTQAQRVALICGAGNGLGAALAVELASRGIHLVLADEAPQEEALLEAARVARGAATESGSVEVRLRAEPEAVDTAADLRAFPRLDYFVDFCVPTRAWSPERVAAYPARLLRRSLTIAECLAGASDQGTAVLHSCLPSAYVDSEFDEYMPMLKGAITGVTRTLCRRFGRRGVIVNCLQTGLVELPELRQLAGERVSKAQVPIGRWATATEVARVVAFLLTQRGYLTGQSLVFDGGLTSGLTGT
jgi:NAD(P)-dependent dehydrogenase (short-subunit alcohol dehydrogenase family)